MLLACSYHKMFLAISGADEGLFSFRYLDQTTFGTESGRKIYFRLENDIKHNVSLDRDSCKMDIKALNVECTVRLRRGLTPKSVTSKSEHATF